MFLFRYRILKMKKKVIKAFIKKLLISCLNSYVNRNCAKTSEYWKGRREECLQDLERTFDISDRSGKKADVLEEDRIWLESVRTDRVFTMSNVVDKKHLKKMKRKIADNERLKNHEKSWKKERKVSYKTNYFTFYSFLSLLKASTIWRMSSRTRITYSKLRICNPHVVDRPLPG